MTRSFRERVFDVVRAIPKGSVLTYAEVAARAGSPRAFRAVGSALKTNFDPAIPCHRVIRSNGKTGEYNRGAAKKIRLLREEGALE
jgi:O-6-methylguanine DNA methyltransferase